METTNAEIQVIHNLSDRHSSLPTIGLLERELSQSIQSTYRRILGQTPKRVVCHLFGQNLAITLEASLTQQEQLLSSNEQAQLADHVRSTTNLILKQCITSLIEECLSVTVIENLIATSLQSGLTGMVVVLSETPKVRNPNAIPKTPGYQKSRH